MNQFTKSELERLYIALVSSMQNIDEVIKLSDKLEKMIDNYCEHQNDPRFNAMPCAGAPKLCTKCNEFYL